MTNDRKRRRWLASLPPAKKGDTVPDSQPPDYVSNDPDEVHANVQRLCWRPGARGIAYFGLDVPGEDLHVPVAGLVLNAAVPPAVLAEQTPNLVAMLRAQADQMEARVSAPDALPADWLEGEQG